MEDEKVDMGETLRNLIMGDLFMLYEIKTKIPGITEEKLKEKYFEELEARGIEISDWEKGISEELFARCAIMKPVNWEELHKMGKGVGIACRAISYMGHYRISIDRELPSKLADKNFDELFKKYYAKHKDCKNYDHRFYKSAFAQQYGENLYKEVSAEFNWCEEIEKREAVCDGSDELSD